MVKLEINTRRGARGHSWLLGAWDRVLWDVHWVRVCDRHTSIADMFDWNRKKNETSPLAIMYTESADIDMPLGINRFTVRHRLPPFYQANAPRETLERIIENKARKNCAWHFGPLLSTHFMSITIVCRDNVWMFSLNMINDCCCAARL